MAQDKVTKESVQKEAERNKRHKVRMERKKKIIDSAIEKSDKSKGLMLVLTGNGKGKSSSAFGMVARSLGHGMKVGVCQFIKSRTDTGEEAFFSSHEKMDWHVLGDGFTWNTQDRTQDIETSENGWKVAQSMLQDPSYDLVVLDELTYLLNYNYLDQDSVLDDIQNRPFDQHVVVTGRGADEYLVDLADTVSEIADVKHAYRAGFKAQSGIDL
ncbi:cob(I)yrinic acid a,c-diamide adenosyltransferase [Cocleimonas flava]|uniref:Corrinoid adenosyltransferase n=1 Tax=Cocleimonas flava TaxID=634765 RepID=A0A4R1F2Z2_9GAMM|nr:MULTISPECIES: cob(I)yrinic acid a,c-diamide adenosyltransferase [Cocleimonas]MEB8430871.1 cob(I)yrinic acid a,c-diamide adenosyltransferase [Cocleimonas sp. KMM 6892]MEC4714357.1 cob(I)yrinic acid a,c-diamide adenosyltransferase [Cocleimonas sp. KMM 6895]MEC4743688.1 cob(I)yrinic acid a,c-diamide adenosyltransferase [Cocleimonas sp. KMM 6896]TCJ88567.1 cob(I)yrinic acid a,c-diamide adenosyltransferase [Cocleimonas flava]